MPTRRLTRRMLLRGLGGAALTIPFLPSLAGRASAGDAPSVRFVGVMSLNGQFLERTWHPSITASTRIEANVHTMGLRDMPGPISRVVGTHFDGLRDKLTLLMGLDGLSTLDHNRCFPLTSSAHEGGSMEMGPPHYPNSIDCVLERSTRFYSTPPVVGALRLNPTFEDRPDWEKSDGFSWWEGRQVPSQWNTEAIFASLFGGATGGGAEPATSAFDPRERRRLVIDRVLADFTRVRASSRLGVDDKERLENYVDHLRDLESRIARTPMISCDGPALTGGGSFDDLYSNHIDMMVAALACGLTRVGVLLVRHCRSDGDEASWHGNSHEETTAAEDYSVELNLWVGQRVAELMAKMDAFVETDGTTLLDNSLVLWSNECGDGKAHYQFDMPVLCAGSAGGQLRTGIAIDYRARPTRRWAGHAELGRPYNQLLTTAMTVCGLEPADWEIPGRPGFGDYQMIGHHYTQQSDGTFAYDDFVGRERDLLPHYLV